MEWVWKVALVTILLVLIAGAVMLIVNPERPTQIIITPGETGRKHRVGIFGAVKSPGYYDYEGNFRIEDVVNLAGGITEDADIISANLAKWIDDGETIIIPMAGPMEPTLTLPAAGEIKVNLNTADLKELMQLPGIGEKRAVEIIRLREEKGGFRLPEEILEISGISENLLDKIYDQVIVE